MSTFTLPDQLKFHGNGGTYPAHGIITADDHGPVVATFTWIFFNLTSLVVLARCLSRTQLTVDFCCILVGWLLLLLQSITVHLASNDGLGRHIDALLPFHHDLYDSYSRAIYASQILRVLIVPLAKISYLSIYIRLLRETSGAQAMLKLFCFGFIGFLGLWSFSSVFALIFQCDTPHPWDFEQNTCVNQKALYDWIGAIDIITDVMVIIIPGIIVFGVKLKRSPQIAVCLMVGTRIIVPIFTIVQLALLNKYFSSGDPTWYNVTPTIYGQAAVNLSLLTACIPSIKPFLDTLQFSLIDCSTLPFTTNKSSISGSRPRKESDNRKVSGSRKESDQHRMIDLPSQSGPRSPPNPYDSDWSKSRSDMKRYESDSSSAQQYV